MLQIFLLDMEGGYRGHASGQTWHEDLQWAHRLDEGWNLAAVKQVSCENIPTIDSCACLHRGLHCISSKVSPTRCLFKVPMTGHAELYTATAGMMLHINSGVV